jgi:hypothetical protein
MANPFRSLLQVLGTDRIRIQRQDGTDFLAGVAQVASAAAGVTAITAGTTRTQAGAAALTQTFNRIDTSTAPSTGVTLGDGVALPASAGWGAYCVVVNNTANPIQVYGNASDTINGVAGATGIPQPPNSIDVYWTGNDGAWLVEAGYGYAGALPADLACTSIAAAGNNQATATPLTAVDNKITTATAGSAFGVKLPASSPGLNIFLENHSGVALQVYGAGTDTIDDVATTTGVSQMDSSVVIFTCYEAGKWYSNGLATGYAKNPTSGSVIETVQSADTISAAGTTQATGTQLVAAMNNVTTVGAGSGVNLPASSAGLSVTVQNSGANPLQVYPFIGATDTINGAVATVGIALLPGTVAVFNCTTAGAWITQPGTTTHAAYNAASNAASFTATAAQLTGGDAFVELDLTGNPAGAANVTLPTVANLVAAMHSVTAGSAFVLRIKNSANTGTWTVVTNTGWTLNGTVTVATGTWRDFLVKVTSLSAMTLQNLGGGATL